MKRLLCWAACVLVLSCVCRAQPQTRHSREEQPKSAVSTEVANLSHELTHLDQLVAMRQMAARTKKARSALDYQITTSVKSALRPVVTGNSAPPSSKAFIQSLYRKRNVEQMRALFGAPSASAHLSSRMRAEIVGLTAILERTQQVLTTDLPVFSVVAIGPGAPQTGLLGISQCQVGNYYPQLTRLVAFDEIALRRLADSVGRIEIKQGVRVPSLIGTAFVISQNQGLVATACHVVESIADLNPQNGIWTVPASAYGNDTSVLIDFGETDAHDPAREFKVTGVEFVPNIKGCDGAILKVSTVAEDNIGRLPPEIPAAKQELQIPPGASNVMVSVGYPDLDEPAPQVATPGNITKETYKYFSCLKSAAPGSKKFLFGGEVMADEPEIGYHILAHIVPTTGGMSGSPIVDISHPDQPQVVGIHVCCVQTAHSQVGNLCEWRAEPYLQEAVSIVDLLNLFHQSASANAQLVPTQLEPGIAR